MSYILDYKKWNKLFEADEMAQIIQIENTGIKLIDLNKGGVDISANIPCIVLEKQTKETSTGDIGFYGKDITITLNSDINERKGAWQRTKGDQSNYGAPIMQGTTPTLVQTLEVVEKITSIFYGPITDNNVMNVVKALKMTRKDYNDMIVKKNTLFVNLYTNISQINNAPNVDAFAKQLGGGRIDNIIPIFNGIKAAFMS